MEQHLCTHTLPSSSPSHRKHHQPARSDRLITFCIREPALWSSGKHEIPRGPSAAKRGESLAGGSRAAPRFAPETGGQVEANPPGAPGRVRPDL